MRQRGVERALALQITIAREGGQQVNVQGDVNGQKTTPPAAGSIQLTSSLQG
jgi:hypothetical protein